MRALLSIAATTAMVTLLSMAPSSAQVSTTDDPAGDGLKGRAMDITSIELDNRDRAVVATVSLVRVASGDIGLRIRGRDDSARQAALVFSKRVRGRQTDGFATGGAVRDCRGLRVRWDFDADVIRLRMPARCWHGGDYGAVHAKVITEIGSDADLAPKGPDGHWTWTPWTTRG